MAPSHIFGRFPGRLASFALALGAVSACGPSGDGAGAAPPSGRAGGTSSKFLASLPLQAEGGTLDLGTILPCIEVVERTATIRNVTKNPVEILGYAANCGCLTPTLKGERVIPPGETRELAFALRPSGYGAKSIRVEFASSGGMVGMLRVDFKVGGAVRPMPPVHDHHVTGKHEAFDFDIVSEEGASFKILSIDPPVGEIVRAQGPRALVRVSTWEAEQFAQSPMGLKSPAVKRDAEGRLLEVLMTVVTDDPACPRSVVSVAFVDP
jgi:hypothetical protein